ncbi:MAG: spore coat associated protein CotJA [Clostridia bacterium]|nr:spore coat associated protein CotJA [Clostridia bacterium]
MSNEKGELNKNIAESEGNASNYAADEDSRNLSCSLCNCGCVGYGYVPWQILKSVYSVEKGFEQGTMFPELDLSIVEYGKICKAVGGV